MHTTISVIHAVPVLVGNSSVSEFCDAAVAALSLQVCAAPDQLLSAVASLDTSQLKPFPAKDACGIIDKIDDFMGRHRATS
jgi:hypothetical protein